MPIPAMIVTVAALAALVAGIAARSFWAATKYALLIWFMCWLTLFILADEPPQYRYAEFSAHLASEAGRVIGICLFALVGHALRRLTKFMQRFGR